MQRDWSLLWTAFPSSDYYGRSATRPPRRRGFSRLAAAYPCDLPTRPGFPGSLADTQTLPVRPRPFCTRQRSAAPPDTGGQSGRAADLGPSRVPRSATPKNMASARLGRSLFRVHYARTASVFAGYGGCFSRRYWSIPVRGHTVALPGGTPTVMKPRLCSALSGELSSRRTRTSRQRTP